MSQITMEFPHEPNYDDAGFFPATCNQEALGWVNQWPDWASKSLVIVGPPGSGKTHLAHIWQRKAKAEFIDAKELKSVSIPDLLDKAPAFIIEDAHKVSSQVVLFHLLNAVRENGKFLLLTSPVAPTRWPFTLPDLKSRLNALTIATLQLPDDELLGSLLRKQFNDKQVYVPEDVIAYIVKRMPRSFEGAVDIAHKIDRAAFEQKKPITIPLAKSVMEQG